MIRLFAEIQQIFKITKNTHLQHATTILKQDQLLTEKLTKYLKSRTVLHSIP